MNYLEMLQKAREKREELCTSIRKATTAQELDNLEIELRKADLEIKDLELKVNAEDAAKRSLENNPTGGLNPLGTYGKRSSEDIKGTTDEDIFGSMEYRQAFKDFIVNGKPIPQEYKEARASELTTVADIGAVIPTTIMNKVIEDLTVEGKILNRITQTGFQGGVAIPISEVNPTATWLASENVVSDEQKAKMDANVTFSYHVLEAKIAIGLLSATVSLSMFENTVVKQLKKAMIRTLETAIVAGTGSGQPLGLTKHTLSSSNVIEIDENTIDTVKQWAEVESLVTEAVEDSGIYIMNKSTWEKYLNGMVDSTGQKIGLGKINEKGQKILNGREVLTTDKLPGFDSATVGDIFGALVDLSQYMLNSNLAMYYKKYYDEDKNKWIHKALMIADGKMAIGNDSSGKLVGAQGLIYLKKKAIV